MKLFLTVLLTTILAFQAGNIFAEKAVKVTKGKAGMYWAVYDSLGAQGLIYQVDTVAKICFVAKKTANGGVSRIPCKPLSARTEWSSIVTW